MSNKQNSNNKFFEEVGANTSQSSSQAEFEQEIQRSKQNIFSKFIQNQANQQDNYNLNTFNLASNNSSNNLDSNSGNNLINNPEQPFEGDPYLQEFQRAEEKLNDRYLNQNLTKSQNTYFSTGARQTTPKSVKTNLTKKYKVESVKKLGNKILKWWWLILIIVVFLCVGLVFSYFQSTLGTQTEIQKASTKISTNFQAPAKLANGNNEVWTLSIQNLNTFALAGVEVDLDFPAEFSFSRSLTINPANPEGNKYKIDRIEASDGVNAVESLLRIEGNLIGNIDQQVEIKGQISLTPEPLLGENQPKEIITISSNKTKIVSPQVFLEMKSKKTKVQTGEQLEIETVFKNLSEKDIEQLRLEITSSKGDNFDIEESSFEISGQQQVGDFKESGRENVWLIKKLPKLEEGIISLKIRLDFEEDVEIFTAELSIKNIANSEYQVLSKTTKQFKIEEQALTLQTSIQGKASDKTFVPGETLNFEIEYQNFGKTSLKDIQITAQIEDPAKILDFSTLNFDGGQTGDLNNKIISWKTLGVPQLANLSPRERGVINYTIKVKSEDKFKQSTVDQSTYTITPTAKIDYQSSNPIEISGPTYKAKGLLQFDQQIKLLESKVGMDIYEVTWRFTSRQNQINLPKVETVTSLSKQLDFDTKITPKLQAKRIKYNPTTGRIIWEPLVIPSYSGISQPAVEITFQLEKPLRQNTSSTGKQPLYSKVTYSGVDDFTSQRYRREVSPKSL